MHTTWLHAEQEILTSSMDTIFDLPDCILHSRIMELEARREQSSRHGKPTLQDQLGLRSMNERCNLQHPSSRGHTEASTRTSPAKKGELELHIDRIRNFLLDYGFSSPSSVVHHQNECDYRDRYRTCDDRQRISQDALQVGEDLWPEQDSPDN